MKNNATIKNLLGLTQEEMSILLGITRSQWAMYETGKRDLPISAKTQLAAMLSHVQNAKKSSHESQKLFKEEQHKAQEKLKQEYQSLELKKRIFEKKLVALENKRAACFAALETVNFLEAQQSDVTNALLESIKLRAKNTLNKFSLHQLQDLQVQKEQLEMLKSNLTQKIKEKGNEL